MEKPKSDDLDEAEMRQRLEDLCRLAGSQSAWAKKNNFSSAYVNYIVRGKRSPSRRLLTALGVKKIVRYQII